LDTESFILVGVEIKHKDLSFGGDSSKNSGGVGRPGHTPHDAVQVEGKHGIPVAGNQ